MHGFAINVSKAHLDGAIEGKDAVVRSSNDAPGCAAPATVTTSCERTRRTAFDRRVVRGQPVRSRGGSLHEIPGS
ncbi:hypothetical protein AMC78_PD00025 (plasmid) [Rhizobium phaseoli]|nr:hypothetical protein AMC78_PD00025 [Rhizobium phaseoli]